MTATARVFSTGPWDWAPDMPKIRSDEEYLEWIREWCRANDYPMPASRHEDDPNMLPLWSLRDLEFMPPAKWFIRNIIEEKGMSVVFGPPGAGKTAVVCSMLWSWLAGAPYWLDPEFKIDSSVPLEERKVVYMLLEGRESVGARFRSWLSSQDLPAEDLDRVRDSFLVLPEAVALWKPNMELENPETWTKPLRKLMNVLAAEKPQIVVVDTLSRATPGMPENAAEQTSVLMDILTRFAQEYGATPIMLHHSTKAEKASIRGSSAIEGAVSSAILIDSTKGSDVRWIVPIKQRNTDLIQKIPFKFVPEGDAFYVARDVKPVKVDKWESVVGLNVAEAADELGIKPKTVYNKAREHGMYVERGILLKQEADEPEVL